MSERVLERFMKDFDLTGYLEQNGVEKLTPSGDNIMGCCPFHDENNPSWGINIHTTQYHCLACGADGNIFTLMRHFGDEPVDMLVDVDIEPDVDDLRQLEKDLEELVREESRSPRIFNMPKSAMSIDNCKERDVSLALYLQIAKRKIILQTCKTFGLKVGQLGVWRHRILVPVHDKNGNYRFFGGRKIEEKGARHKWRYPKGCDRSSEVYNLHRVKAMGRAVIVEGFFDVMKLHQMEIPAVSLMSSQISEKQIALLSQFDRVYLMLDGDFAGKLGTNTIGCKLFGKGIQIMVIYLASQMDPDRLPERKIYQLMEAARPIATVKRVKNRLKIILA